MGKTPGMREAPSWPILVVNAEGRVWCDQQKLGGAMSGVIYKRNF